MTNVAKPIVSTRPIELGREKTENSGRPLWALRVFLLCAGLFLILFVNREFSVADNGDFTRYVQSYLVKPAGQEVNWPAREAEKAWHNRFFEQPIMYWEFGDHPELPTWSTSANVFWKAGGALNAMFYSDRALNVKYAGLCFFLLQAFAFAVVICTASGRTLSVITALLIVFFALTDAQISAFYNSFYAESVPLLAMLSMFAYFITRVLPDSESRTARRLSSLLGGGTLILLCLAIFSKRQYLYFVIPSMLMTYHLLISNWDVRRSAKAALFLACGLAITGLTIGLTYADRVKNNWEKDMARITSYDALYYGLLPQSHEQDKLLLKLGLPPESANLIGKSAWDEATQQFIRNTPQISVKAYLKAIYLDPRAFIRSVLVNAKQIGNLNIDLGMVPGTQKQHPPPLTNIFSSISTQLAGQGMFLVATLLAALMVLFRFNLDDDRFGANRMLALILLAILYSDLLVSTFDGQQEARKHLLLGSLAAALIVSQMLTTASNCARIRQLSR